MAHPIIPMTSNWKEMTEKEFSARISLKTFSVRRNSWLTLMTIEASATLWIALRIRVSSAAIASESNRSKNNKIK
jgi:hypothetical protein